MTSPAKIHENNPGAVIPFVPAKESFSGLTYYFSRYKLRRYNTSRQQLYALRRWSGWCMQPSNHVYLARDEHGAPCSFPFKPEGIAAFVRHLAGHEPDTDVDGSSNTTFAKKLLSYSSIKQYISLLNMIQKGARMADYPAFMDHYLVQDELNELRIDQASNEVKESQALPLMLDDMHALISLHSRSDELKRVRNLLMLWVGFETLMRNDELARLKLKDISYSPADKQYSLVMRRSKTNKDFAPVYYVLSKACSACIDHMFKLAETGPSPHHDIDRYLFRPLSAPAGNRFAEEDWDSNQHSSVNTARKTGSENRSLKGLLASTFGVNASSIPGMRDVDEEVSGMLSTRAFRDGIRHMWETLKPSHFETHGGRYQTWTGHSARVGGAIELMKQGYSESQIMQMGNWKTMSMVLRYTRNMTGKDKAMAQVASQHFDNIPSN